MFQSFNIKPASNNLKFNKFLSETKKGLSDFFGVKTEQPNVFFVNSRKDINKIWGTKTENWMSGWAKNGNIFILNPKIYTKESNHTKKHFWQTIKHEYCHLYFKQLTGTSYPKWLNEGLACYLAGQVKKKPAQEEALRVFNYFQKGDQQIYSVGYFWVRFLIEKFGRKKFLTLLNLLEPELTENKFKFIFLKVYKIDFSKKDLNLLIKDNI